MARNWGMSLEELDIAAMEKLANVTLPFCAKKIK